MGKGEIARYEQFLLFPQCFQKACFPEASKNVIVLEWVNPSQSTILDSPKLNEFADDSFEVDANDGKFSEGVEKAVGKGEIAGLEQFLIFPVFSKDL